MAGKVVSRGRAAVGLLLVVVVFGCGPAPVGRGMTVTDLFPDEGAPEEAFDGFDMLCDVLHRTVYYEMTEEQAITSLGPPLKTLRVVPRRLKAFDVPVGAYMLEWEVGGYHVYLIVDEEQRHILNAISVDPVRNTGVQFILSRGWVLRHKVRSGMSEDEVRAICGDPDFIHDGAEHGDATVYHWFYYSSPRRGVASSITFSKKDRTVQEGKEGRHRGILMMNWSLRTTDHTDAS